MCRMPKKLPFIYLKLVGLVKKNRDKGTFSMTSMEEHIARDFRLCREDVKEIFREISLTRLDDDIELIRKKKIKSTNRAMVYKRTSDDDFLADLQAR